jgi:hypothetical protein
MKPVAQFEHMIKVRIPLAWKPQLDAEAKSKGMTFSELIRDLIKPQGA